MKRKTTTKAAQKQMPDVDLSIYSTYNEHPPLVFNAKEDAKLWDKRFVMKAAEFKHLRPRELDSIIIGDNPPMKGEKYRTAELVYIYITDGIRYIDKEAGVYENTAYSFFVRIGDNTWKAEGICECFSIINGIRLAYAKWQREEIADGVRRAKQEAKEKQL